MIRERCLEREGLFHQPFPEVLHFESVVRGVPGS